MQLSSTHREIVLNKHGKIWKLFIDAVRDSNLSTFFFSNRILCDGVEPLMIFKKPDLYPPPQSVANKHTRRQPASASVEVCLFAHLSHLLSGRCQQHSLGNGGP